MAEDSTPETEARRADGSSRPRRRRLPIPGVLVAIDAPGLDGGPWVVDALDVNAGGLGLVLPPELPEGTRVLLSFKLDDAVAFSRQPGAVSHVEGATGGVHFGLWPSAERSRLLEYLVAAYEREG